MFFRETLTGVSGARAGFFVEIPRIARRFFPGSGVASFFDAKERKAFPQRETSRLSTVFQQAYPQNLWVRG
jgi:hypothetical protein